LNDIAKHGTSGRSSDGVQVKLDNACNDEKVCVDCDSSDCWSSGRTDSGSAYPKMGEKGTVNSNVKHGRVLIDTRHSYDDVMVGGRAESLNIVSNCIDDKPKVGVKVEVHICSNIEQRRVLMDTRHSQGDTELDGCESVTTVEVRERRIASGDDSNVKAVKADNVKMERVFVVSRHSQDYRDDIDVIGGMECSGINGHYAEYVVAWKCNEKEYDCSLAVLYEVKVKGGLDTSTGSEVGRYGTVKHDATLDDESIDVVNFNSEVKDNSVGMCNSEVNDLMVLMFICLLLVWTAKDIVYSGEQESRIEKLYLAWNASMESNVWRSLMSSVWKSQKTTGLCRYLSVGRVLESVITLYMTLCVSVQRVRT